MLNLSNWIGVDFDGTLVTHKFPKIGDPVWPMIDRVKKWLAEGQTVKIFTAQVARDSDEYGTADERRKLIQNWCETVGLPRLEVTATKDFYMIRLYDDRAERVEKDTGKILDWDTAYDAGYDDGYKDAMSSMMERY
jgi:hypothetical protein